jgi:hypothetical protein
MGLVNRYSGKELNEAELHEYSKRGRPYFIKKGLQKLKNAHILLIEATIFLDNCIIYQERVKLREIQTELTKIYENVKGRMKA